MVVERGTDGTTESSKGAGAAEERRPRSCRDSLGDCLPLDDGLGPGRRLRRRRLAEAAIAVRERDEADDWVSPSITGMMGGEIEDLWDLVSHV